MSPGAAKEHLEMKGWDSSNRTKSLEESHDALSGGAGALHPTLWTEHQRQLQLEAFRCIYGSSVARELIPVEARLTGSPDMSGPPESGGGGGGGYLEPATGEASAGAFFSSGGLGMERTQEEGPQGSKAVFSMRALMSSANYSAKKTTFILFINGMPTPTQPTVPLLG